MRDVWAEQSEEYKADPCSKAGALRLKRCIEEYWVAHGFPKPTVILRDEGFLAALRTTRTDIRSDMHNGMPRSALPASRRAA